MQFLTKTCFFEKISIIKLSAKTHLSLNFKHMGGTNKALAVATLSTLMATTTPVNAETTKNLTQEQIICETKEICQKLSQTIQAQINNLESKANLTRTDRIKISQLRDELIAVEKSETAIQQKTIADENQKQAKQKETIDDIDETNKKLDELRGILLSK
jgi:small-conductance mechanosensitive channel